MFEVSVIIPVYNAERYVENAVQSSIEQIEVKEVLLIEDGSTDNSLQICEKLQKLHPKVKLIRHEDGKNNGASATRNLGMQHAKQPFISFLDADDYYLPNRFKAENKLFETYPDIDGVYGALGFHYYSDDLKNKTAKVFHTKLTTVTEEIAPEKLKYTLIGMCRADKGYFSIDALTIKKQLLTKAGYISEEFDLHEDTHFMIKLSFCGKLLSGIIDTPIGMRGVHESNRITSVRNNAYSKFLMLNSLEKWVLSNVEGEEHAKRFISKDRKVYQLLSSNKNRLAKSFQLFSLFKNEPFAFYIEFSFNKLMYGIFGGKLGRLFVRLRNKLLNTVLKKQAQKWDSIIYDHYCD